LAQLLYGATPTIRSGNLPNVYCGMLAVLLLPIYLTTSAIPLRRRLTMGGLLAAVTFSATLNIPDLIWHGLHAPNDLPYRFSFLISFVLLLIAYEVLTHLKDLKPRQIGLSAAAIAAAIFVLEKIGTVEKLTGAEKAAELPFASVYVSVLLVAIYAGILLLSKHKAVTQRLAASLLLLVVTLEMTLGAGNTLDTLNSNEYFTNHDNYVDNLETDAIRLAVARTEELAAKDVGDGFYRMEFLPRRTCVDTALFEYAGITTFDSSNTYETTRLMGSLGYAVNGVNSYLYKSFVASTDSLLGVRYVILESNISNHKQLKKLDSVTVSREDEYGTTETKTLYIYENTTALPLAYFVNNEIRGFSYNYYSPFDTQNRLYQGMTGKWDDLYTFCELETQDEGGYTSGVCGFTVSGGNVVDFTANVTEAGQYFLFGDCRAAESISVSCNGNSWDITPHEPFIIDAGTLSAGTEVEFTVDAESTASGNLYVAKLNRELFDETNATLAANGMTVTKFTDSHIEGTITAPENGCVMTSLVYDEGWTVLVDGQPVETFAIGQGLIGFDVTAGEHTVTMTFFPKGLKLGLIISGVCLLLLILLVLLRRRADLYREAELRLAARKAEEEAAAAALVETAEAAPDGAAAPAGEAAAEPPAEMPAETAEAVPTEEVAVESVIADDTMNTPTEN
ncbi:MAG: YfhO family protein, partial [Clostridia bacterium]|nr:YfhO family protein [Clostridia bacterium]